MGMQISFIDPQYRFSEGNLEITYVLYLQDEYGTNPTNETVYVPLEELAEHLLPFLKDKLK